MITQKNYSPVSLKFEIKSIPGRIFGVVIMLLVIGMAFDSVSAQQQDPTPDTGMTAGWEEGSFFLKSEDGNYLLSFGGRIQPRYQYQTRIGQESLSSFYLRRIRLDLQGHLFDEKFTFRIMPEMARTANLRDGWVNYSFSRQLNVKAGQFSVPFHRQRYISGSRQHFAERSLASDDFGFPSGYDVGLGIHGRNEANTFSYGAGIFDGAGRNVRDSNSNGNLASVRLTRALTGVLPRDETDYNYTENPQLTLGAALQGATKNEARDWDIGRSATGNTRADWLAGTADLSVNWKGLSLATDFFVRTIDPDDPTVSSYTGTATAISAGYFIIKQQVELTGRFSEINLDTRVDNTKTTDWEAGVNIYHQGHNLKTFINYLNRTLPSGTEHVFLVQLHMMF